MSARAPAAEPRRSLVDALTNDLRVKALMGDELPSRSDVAMVLQRFCEATSDEAWRTVHAIYDTIGREADHG